MATSAKPSRASGLKKRRAAVLVKRGQARWLHYLQEKKQANAPLKKDDEAVVQAAKDFADAKTAEGTYWLGLIEEATSGPAAARKVYQAGAAKFKTPADQRLFQAALDRLDATPAAGQQVSRAPRLADAALVLAAMTIALQDQPAAPKQDPAASSRTRPRAGRSQTRPRRRHSSPRRMPPRRPSPWRKPAPISGWPPAWQRSKNMPRRSPHSPKRGDPRQGTLPTALQGPEPHAPTRRNRYSCGPATS